MSVHSFAWFVARHSQRLEIYQITQKSIPAFEISSALCAGKPSHIKVASTSTKLCIQVKNRTNAKSAIVDSPKLDIFVNIKGFTRMKNRMRVRFVRRNFDAWMQWNTTWMCMRNLMDRRYCMWRILHPMKEFSMEDCLHLHWPSRDEWRGIHRDAKILIQKSWKFLPTIFVCVFAYKFNIQDIAIYWENLIFFFTFLYKSWTFQFFL